MSAAPVGAALVAFLVYFVAERLWELAVSARADRALRARGAREFGAAHFPWIVLVHALYPMALVAEILRVGARPERFAALWLAGWIAAQALRFAAMRALGDRWSARVLVLPGAPRIVRGPYRWFAHPNYLAVFIETIAGAMMFGAWRTAAAFGVAQALVLAVRIRCEERAFAAVAAPVPPRRRAAR
ncbi:MAG: hypothetical protein HY076_02100 [Candidatus Eisenbacteria bacterium]|uniref:Isoprenylcysteine carboxyl methyltransferase n=1 Tax=Eiseniibacteriota bacterium TaxID=2212470 RepID=A0A9D6QNL1_UNCEI|nr:hypothetical protein [Candidatus Eisenbacteria bacterium]MBI3539049.1 hypothetical protein [Candidatus Eisenbacteria bacterium]